MQDLQKEQYIGNI